MISVGVNIDDEEILHIVLQGLPTDFHSFTSAMLTKNELIRLEELHNLMKTEEDLLKSVADNSKELTHMAMATNKSSPSNFNNSSTTQFNTQFNAHRGRGGGHNQHRGCDGGRFQNYNNSRGNFNNSQNPQSWNPNPSSRLTCQICYKPGHTAIDCYQRMNYAYQRRHPPAKLATMATAALIIPNQITWISDTGATDHFTLDLNNIPDNKAYTDSQLISVGNGHQLPISHLGNAQLRTSSSLFRLRKVLHVPNITSNLLSVQSFCRDNACSFHFNAHHFQILDLLTGKPLYKGFSKDGLYPIHGLSLPSLESRLSSLPSRSSATSPFQEPSYASYKACVPSARHNASLSDLWHMRLGHPQSRVVQTVLQKQFCGHSFPVSNSFCKHCVMGKMT